MEHLRGLLFNLAVFQPKIEKIEMTKIFEKNVTKGITPNEVLTLDLSLSILINSSNNEECQKLTVIIMNYRSN